MPPTPLCLLARKYGSDKFSAKHSYTRWYWDEFKDRRESVRKVVEIGVGEGASLRMWREFFPNAEIYGLDNEPERVFVSDRITCYRVDQSNGNVLMYAVGLIGRKSIDIFIDDGSHVPADQVFTCLTVLPLLAKGATYVIEDVADPDLGAKLKGYDVYEPDLELRKRYDNRLLVVRHRA